MITTTSEFCEPRRRRQRRMYERTFEIPIGQVVQTGQEGWVLVTAAERPDYPLPLSIQVPIEATERAYVGQMLRITVQLVPEDADP
jgi:hypothetical protein